MVWIAFIGGRIVAYRSCGDVDTKRSTGEMVRYPHSIKPAQVCLHLAGKDGIYSRLDDDDRNDATDSTGNPIRCISAALRHE